jgi:DNA helicase IV
LPGSRPPRLAFEDSLKSALPTRDHRNLEISTAHSFKGLERFKVIVIDAVDRGYPLIHPNWIFFRIFGDTLDEVVAAERRLFYVALTRATHDLVIITDSKRPSGFLADLRKRMSIDSLNWNHYRPATTQNAEFHIRLKNSSKSGGTYPIKDQIKACGYRWHSGSDSCWRKSVSAARFSLNRLRSEPWANGAVSVCVLIDTDDDETIAWYEVDQGRWKVLKDDLH